LLPFSFVAELRANVDLVGQKSGHLVNGNGIQVQEQEIGRLVLQ